MVHKAPRSFNKEQQQSREKKGMRQHQSGNHNRPSASSPQPSKNLTKTAIKKIKCFLLISTCCILLVCMCTRECRYAFWIKSLDCRLQRTVRLSKLSIKTQHFCWVKLLTTSLINKHDIKSEQTKKKKKESVSHQSGSEPSHGLRVRIIGIKICEKIVVGPPLETFSSATYVSFFYLVTQFHFSFHCPDIVKSNLLWVHTATINFSLFSMSPCPWLA